MANPPEATDAIEPAPPSTEPLEATVPDPTAAHRSSQRRLLFAIELTLFGLVLVVASPENAQAGIFVAVLGLLLGLSGL